MLLRLLSFVFTVAAHRIGRIGPQHGELFLLAILAQLKAPRLLEIDPFLYTTINCTVLQTENSALQLIVVYRGGLRSNVDL